MEEIRIDGREEFAMKLAFCGNDCSVCPRYVATQSGDIEQLKKVAALWHKAGYRDTVLPPEELICHGCSSTMCNREDRRALRDCAVRKSVENCGRCEEYPCKKASNVFEQVELATKDIKERCSKQEYDCLRKAFLSRKENLDRANKEWRLRRKTQRARFVR